MRLFRAAALTLEAIDDGIPGKPTYVRGGVLDAKRAPPAGTPALRCLVASTIAKSDRCP